MLLCPSRLLPPRATLGALVFWLFASGVLPALGAEPPAAPLLRLEPGVHTTEVFRIGTDAANRYLVTGSADKTARVWDLTSGRLVQVLRPPLAGGREGMIGGVAMSPDGSSVAVGGWTGYMWDSSYSVYVFDRASGRMIRRITGFPAPIYDLAWSADDRYLAAALRNGIRVVPARAGVETPAEIHAGTDTSYGDRSYSVDFHSSNRLVSSSWDGMIRLYTLNERGLTLTHRKAAPGGKQPTSARFSADGSRIAVGYSDSLRVDVFSGTDLTYLYSPDVKGMSNGYLPRVTWSLDGRRLYAAGAFDTGGWFGLAKSPKQIRAWVDGGRGKFVDLETASDVTDLAALRSGGLVFSSFFDPLFTVLDARDKEVVKVRPVTGDPKVHAEGSLRTSPDGRQVQFELAVESNRKTTLRFDLGERRLLLDPANDAALTPANTTARGLDIADWDHRVRPPTLNGQPLPLQTHENSLSLAIAPSQQSFVLGTSWSLRRFDRSGAPVWNADVPGRAWGVNVSGDGRLVVAAFGDGTIRWYRFSDGKELLALFTHADRKRWVLWSPSGYYDAAPGAEELIGWHVNRGVDQAADFYPASRFRAAFYRPDVVAKILETLDEDAGLRLADGEAGRKTQTVAVASSLPPVVEIVAPADGVTVSTADVRVQIRVRTAADTPVLGLRARVNGQVVKLPDERTTALRAKPADALDLVIPVPPQDSDIMLFAENRHGVSVPALLHVAWRAPAATAATAGAFDAKPKLYVLAVGVGRYQDATLTLQYPAKDARDFAQAMLAQKGRLYRDVEVKLLTDGAATRDEVVDGLDWLQKQVTSKDVGMLFLAGHGVNDPNGTWYYLPVNGDLEKLKRTGVPYSDIKNTLASLAGKALFFVDTCHSGNVMGGRRTPTDVTGVMNELASAENGVVVFASSTGKQYSMESDEWQNGAFTKAVVEGVTGRADINRTGRVTHKMLDLYVAERVKDLTGGKQAPVNASPQGVPDFPIALVTAP